MVFGDILYYIVWKRISLILLMTCIWETKTARVTLHHARMWCLSRGFLCYECLELYIRDQL